MAGVFLFPALLRYFFMIKLRVREMKNLSRILTVILCCVPVLSANAGPVATTAGNNLTAYNPSNTNNNQWAMMVNGRYDTNNANAKVDFGNCNAVVLRCAQPKCGTGCTDYTVAGQIVAGCVKSNEKCKQYGDDLVNYMTAQLVANANAKINEQNAAIEQARIQAEAQAAAVANQQSQEQIAQMQNQMAQMQQQMYQQQQESQQQLQAALEQQAAQSAAALESMKTAATDAAQQTAAGITSYQQEAIDRGISQDILARQQITGQIMTEIEDAELKLKNVKTVLQNSFDYAGCDARGNNCRGPKRVKKWRELATDFIENYDTTIDKVYDALILAQTVGVDLSQIYMMLNDSCNSWGQYMCEAGSIDYSGPVPVACSTSVKNDLANCQKNCYTDNKEDTNAQKKCRINCTNQFGCKKCTLLKLLTNSDEDAIYEGWVTPDDTTDGNGTVVACASDMINTSALFARRTKNKNGAGLVDINKLETWLYQVEPDRAKSDDAFEYCNAQGREDVLKQAIAKRSVHNLTKKNPLCVNDLGKTTEDKEDCGFVNKIFGICDTHPYNAGEKGIPTDTNTQDKIREILGLKITVISQQMYKQYEYLKATLKRLQTQLEKAVLTANLEAAGAKSEDGSSSGLAGGGSSKNSQYRDCTGKNKQSTLDCLRENYAVLSNEERNKKCKKDCKAQIKTDLGILNSMLSTGNQISCKTEDNKDMTDKECLQKLNGGFAQLDSDILKEESDRRGYGR